MDINERCVNWSLVFSLDNGTLLSESQLEKVRLILHFAGDLVGTLNKFPVGTNKDRALTNFIGIIQNAKTSADQCLDELLAEEAWETPLEGDLELTKIIGEDLEVTLGSLVTSEDEATALNQALQLDDDEEEEDEDETDFLSNS